MLRRLLVGLLKGLAIGGAIGALLHFGGIPVLPGWAAYLLYGAVVGLAGALAGQPPWRQGAWVASILKFVFGFGVGAGLYALASHFLHLPVDVLPDVPPNTELAQAPLAFAPAAAALYAMLVELDDGGEQPVQEKRTGVRVKADALADLDEVPAEREQKGSTRARR